MATSGGTTSNAVKTFQLGNVGNAKERIPFE